MDVECITKKSVSKLEKFFFNFYFKKCVEPTNSSNRISRLTSRLLVPDLGGGLDENGNGENDVQQDRVFWVHFLMSSFPRCRRCSA